MPALRHRASLSNRRGSQTGEALKTAGVYLVGSPSPQGVALGYGVSALRADFSLAAEEQIAATEGFLHSSMFPSAACQSAVIASTGTTAQRAIRLQP